MTSADPGARGPAGNTDLAEYLVPVNGYIHEAEVILILRKIAWSTISASRV